MYTACILLGAISPDHKKISFGKDMGELLRYQDFAIAQGLMPRPPIRT